MTDRVVVPIHRKYGKEWLKSFEISRWDDDRVEVRARRNGEVELRGQAITFHIDNIDAIIRGLQKIQCGPLGRLAMEAEDLTRREHAEGSDDC